ncbi:MAG: hypothetical protein V4449_03615 [Patescibacteria group bacterium]
MDRKRTEGSRENVEIKTVKDAYLESRGTSPGERALESVIDQFQENPNSPALKRFKQDGYYFFFGTVSGNYVTCLHRAGQKLDRMATWLGAPWKKDFYVVGSE